MFSLYLLCFWCGSLQKKNIVKETLKLYCTNYSTEQVTVTVYVVRYSFADEWVRTTSNFKEQKWDSMSYRWDIVSGPNRDVKPAQASAAFAFLKSSDPTECRCAGWVGAGGWGSQCCQEQGGYGDNSVTVGLIWWGAAVSVLVSQQLPWLQRCCCLGWPWPVCLRWREGWVIMQMQMINQKLKVNYKDNFHQSN